MGMYMGTVLVHIAPTPQNCRWTQSLLQAILK